MAAERTTAQRLETERTQLERQNKELLMKLDEMETQVKLKFKTAIQSLEGKVSNLEEQLDVESRFATGN